MPKPLFISGKCLGRSPIEANAIGPNEGLYVHDRHSGHRILVDSGALASILPPTARDSCVNKVGPVLSAVNGSNIRTYGYADPGLKF